MALGHKVTLTRVYVAYLTRVHAVTCLLQDPKAGGEFVKASSVVLRDKMRVSDDEETRKACWEVRSSVMWYMYLMTLAAAGCYISPVPHQRDCIAAAAPPQPGMSGLNSGVGTNWGVSCHSQFLRCPFTAQQRSASWYSHLDSDWHCDTCRPSQACSQGLQIV
jgi:hypothetical protein